MMKKVPYKNGFTLIELVLVMTILVVVGMALYGTFASGISIWKRVTQQPVTEDVNLFFAKISHDLRNSFKITGIKFRGGKNHISFPARIQYQDIEEIKDSVGRVSYFFDRRKGALNKQELNYSEVYLKRDGRKRMLAKGISSLQFQYFIYNQKEKKYSWMTSWQERDEPFGVEVEDNLPLIVRVEVGIPKGKFEQKFVKTIPIPSACCWPFEGESE